MFSSNKDTFKQLIQTSLRKICFNTLGKLFMMNFLFLAPFSLSVFADFTPLGSEYRSIKPIECGSNADPDPKQKHCYKQHIIGNGTLVTMVLPRS
jgi:hypothetical protein